MNGSLKLILLLAAICAFVYFRGMKAMNQDNAANGSQRRGRPTVIFHETPTNSAIAARPR
jgi:hypothetical protein